MKNLIYFLSIIFAVAAVSCDDEKVVAFDSLPSEARLFINTHFDSSAISHIQKDNDGYDVYFTNGFEIEFNSNGEWDKVDGNYQRLPDSFLALSPLNLIVSDIVTKYPDAYICEVDKDTFYKKYEVKLNNSVELIYNWDGTYRKMDD